VRLLDPFGRTAERRMERRLIADYEKMVDEITGALAEANYAHAVALARIPDAIRGYGPVKEAAVKKAEAEKADLIARFRNPVPQGAGKAAKGGKRKPAEAAE
jgi:indolepyruvate ferredoxin oxidoreductase